MVLCYIEVFSAKGEAHGASQQVGFYDFKYKDSAA